MLNLYCDMEMRPLNYMLTTGIDNYKIVGFKKLHDVYNWWGLEIGGHNYCTVFQVNGDLPYLKTVSDEIEKEQRLIDDGYVYCLYLKGSDDTSYVVRFKTLIDAQYFLDQESLNCYDDETVYLFFN